MKFYEDMIIHVNIVEVDKDPAVDRIGKTLRISSDTYESLEEIEMRFVKEIERKIKDIWNHPKFVAQFKEFEDLKNFLEDEKAKNPSMIPYWLAILSPYPQHIVLAYLPPSSTNKVIKEFIKVKPWGFQFHDNHYPSIDHLIGFFKQSYGNVDYWRYVKWAKSPRA